MKYLTAAELQKAMKSLEKDARARMLAQSCVAFAMQEHGPVNPEKADRDAHDIASLAAHLVVSRIYLEDAELRELKERVAELEKLAFDVRMTTIPSMFIHNAAD